MPFHEHHDAGAVLPHGHESLAASFGARPIASSDGYGWKGLTGCSWRVELDEYEIPEAPETLVALHSRGPVVARTERGWGVDRSFPGEITVIPPRTWSAIRPLRTTTTSRRSLLDVTTIHLPNASLENMLGGREVRRSLGSLRMRWGFVDAFLSASVSRLAEEIRSPSERGSLYADTLADAIMLHLLREADRAPLLDRAPGGLGTKALQLARDRIEAGLADGVSLDDLARQVGLSRYHFSRAFKASTGLSPHRYLTLRRVEKAKNLLGATELSLVDVALEVGFASQSHLCDWFRRLVGVSPREYRRGR